MDDDRDEAGDGDVRQRDRVRVAAGSFSTPVAITAGTVYVASYFAPAGTTPQTTATSPPPAWTTRPLHALQDGVSGGNGVYAYGSTSTFPNNTWQSSNYWVDVVFATGPGDRAGGADQRDRDGRGRVGGGELDRALGRRQRDHQLHGDPVHRDDRADPDHGDRQPAGDHGDGDRADQRHRLHVQGVGDQRGRHRPRLGRVELGHPCGGRVHGVHDLGVVGDTGDPQLHRHRVGRSSG